MGWLVNLAIIFIIGYFTLGLSRGKIKNNQSGDVLPRYTAQGTKAEVEKESREIIKRELSHIYAQSYERIRSEGRYGFLHYYLQCTENDETLTTAAKPDIVKTLGENDLLGDLTLFLIVFCKLISNDFN